MLKMGNAKCPGLAVSTSFQSLDQSGQIAFRTALEEVPRAHYPQHEAVCPRSAFDSNNHRAGIIDFAEDPFSLASNCLRQIVCDLVHFLLRTLFITPD